MNVQIVDEEARPGAQSYALALHQGTLELLDSVGLLAETMRAGHLVNHVAFYDQKERLGEISLDRLHAGYPAMVVLGQDALERILLNGLHNEGVEVGWNHRLSAVDQQEGTVSAAVDTLDVDGGGYAVYCTDWSIESSTREEPAFVIGADGYRSCLRRALDIDFREMGPTQLYAIFEFASGEEIEDEMRIVFGDESTDVIWPLGENRCRWSFQLHDNLWGDDSRSKQRLAIYIGGAAYPHLTMEELRQLANRRAPWFRGWMGDLHWAIMVRFEQRLASRFGSGRCWLAGDAAHLAGPVGVHSMNIGLREGHELANQMVEILRNGVPVATLDHYNAARLTEWEHLFHPQAPLIAGPSAPSWVRGREQRILNALPASGPVLARMLHHLGISEPELAPT